MGKLMLSSISGLARGQCHHDVTGHHATRALVPAHILVAGPTHTALCPQDAGILVTG